MRNKNTPATIIEYRTDEMTHETFTYGDCWVLAQTLHQEQGWKYIYADGTSAWCHVAVVHEPTGLVLDIDGLTDINTWTAKWSARKISDITTTEWFDEQYPIYDDSHSIAYETMFDLLDLAETVSIDYATAGNNTTNDSSLIPA